MEVTWMETGPMVPLLLPWVELWQLSQLQVPLLPMIPFTTSLSTLRKAHTAETKTSPSPSSLTLLFKTLMTRTTPSSLFVMKTMLMPSTPSPTAPSNFTGWTIQNCQRAVNVEYLITQDYQDVYIDHVVFQNISLNAIWIEFASSIAVKDSIFQLPLGDAYNAFINVIGNFTSGIDIINNEFQDGSGIQITNMNGGKHYR